MTHPEPRIDVFYGVVANVAGLERRSYVVVRTNAEHIDHHANVYEPACEYEVLYEVPSEEIEKRNIPIMAEPGWASPEAKRLVFELWDEKEPPQPALVPVKRRYENAQTICEYFLAGRCILGAECKFSHEIGNAHNPAENEQEGDPEAVLHLPSNEIDSDVSEGEVELKEGSALDDDNSVPREWEAAQDPKNMSLDLHGGFDHKEWESDRGTEGDELEEEVAVIDEGPVHQLLVFLSSKDFSYLPDAGDFEQFELVRHFDRFAVDMQETKGELIRLVEECLHLHDPTELARVVLECDNHGCNMLAVFVLRLLFHRGADPGIVAGTEQVTMPIVAAEWGDGEFLMELIERGVRVDHRGPNGMTVMHYLVSNLPNLDPRKLQPIVIATQALLALEPNLTLRSHTQETVLQVLEQNIELGGLSFPPDSPPPEIWQLCALFQQAISDFEVHPCLKCGRPAANNRCSRCQVARYCGAACQKQHWKFHKRVCVEKVETKTEQL